MIKDFTPARTSLSSGVVVKQHILERNRIRPAQVTSSNEVYEGLIKPFSRDYNTGSGDTGQYEYASGSSIYRFSGGTGGTLDQFNGIEFYPTTVDNIYNVTQSWDESFSTTLGITTYDRDDQREFYNGEFSGSDPYVRLQRGLGNADDPCAATLKINPNNFYIYQLEFYGGPDNDYTITSAIPPTPTPTPSPTATPTPTPTLTPTPTPTPTPTLFTFYLNSIPVTPPPSPPGIFGTEQLGAVIRDSSNVIFNGGDNYYIAYGSSFNTFSTPGYPWVALQIDSSGVVTNVLDSDGNTI